jgi:hypothetical protein
MGSSLRKVNMKTNWVRFQPGLSMAEFVDRYGTDEQCEAALIDSRCVATLPARCAAAGRAARFAARPAVLWYVKP